jgi:hypothetical protein
MKRAARELKDKLSPKGRVEIFISRGMPALKLGFPVGDPCNKVFESCAIDFSGVMMVRRPEILNIIVNQGKDQVITNLTPTGVVYPIVRMSIGDRGTIPSDQTVPKVPVATATTLYDEVYRDDIDATVLNVGTPTVHQVQFVKAFSSLVIPLTSFSNQANPIVNEVGLITANLNITPLPRAPVAAPATPPSDEKLFATRTFNSVPFLAANQIAVTVRYTIFIE